MRIHIKVKTSGGAFGGMGGELSTSEVDIAAEEFEAQVATATALMLLTSLGVATGPLGDFEEDTTDASSEGQDAPSDSMPAEGWKDPEETDPWLEDVESGREDD